MSDIKDNKKKGFFSNLFSGFGSSKQSKEEESTSNNSNDIPSKAALNKMKKADIVSVAKEYGLELDISLTKAKLLDDWEIHFDKSSAPSAVDDAATAMAESAAEAAEEAPVEEAKAEVVAEATEEAPVEEEVEISLDEKSPAQIINSFESKQMKSDIPEFRPGDTVVVSVRVKEGDRTRLQAFEGVVMGVKKAGLNSSFIVRKISSGIGVERTFQTHSPMIDSINVKRKGDVRQAKLFYLRERSGKSARIKERLE